MSNTIETAKELIAIPSYSGQEEGVRNYLETRFKNAGISFIEQGDNLAVHLRGIDGTRAFMFNSHMDVVDIGNPKMWSHDPWGGDIQNGIIYGRGAADMKGGLAASIETALQLSNRLNLPTDVWFMYVTMEEEDGSGTKTFAQWFSNERFAKKYKEMAGIFTEPTALLAVEHGHKGNYFIDATVKGNVGHSGRPYAIAVNATEQLARFITSLQKINEEWKNQFPNGIFTAPTVTATAFTAESASYNKTAGEAVAHLDLRTIPGYHGDLFMQIKTLANTYNVNLTLHCPDAPTGYTTPDAKIIKVMQEIIPELKLEVSEASADLGFLTEIGVEGVIFGPGEKETAHQIDESAPVDQIEKAPLLFTQIYDTWAEMK
ncbi:M20/M25/M40 family metallo-hydrolase [Patescibacteria group bacterium]|nr:M20/M25/M40 family metallo-hydrolase [Patescibacteria group bacterium]